MSAPTNTSLGAPSHPGTHQSPTQPSSPPNRQESGPYERSRPASGHLSQLTMSGHHPSCTCRCNTVAPSSSSQLKHADFVSPRHSQASATDLVPTASTKHEHVRAALGLNPHAPIVEAHDTHPVSQLWWARVRLVMREPFAEFCGTAILILFGCGSVAQVLLGQGITGAPGKDGFGGYQSISWG